MDLLLRVDHKATVSFDREGELIFIGSNSCGTCAIEYDRVSISIILSFQMNEVMLIKKFKQDKNYFIPVYNLFYIHTVEKNIYFVIFENAIPG